MPTKRELFTVLEAVNPIVPKNTIVVESDTGRIKTGDGATRYNALQYSTEGGAAVPESDPVAGSALAAHIADLLQHSSGKEVGYSENITGVTLGLTTGMLAIAGVAVVVPTSPRPQYLHFGLWADVTTAAAAATTGNVAVNVVDETAAVWAADFFPFEGADSLGYAQLKGMARIPPNTPEHTYSLLVSRSGNATFRASIMNGAAGSAAFRSYLAVLAA